MQRRSDGVIVPALARAAIGSHGLHAAATVTGTCALGDMIQKVCLSVPVQLCDSYASCTTAKGENAKM